MARLAAARATAGDPSKLQIMYGVGGRAGPRRSGELGWLPGYEGSEPGAGRQRRLRQYQLDVYGEVMVGRSHGKPDRPRASRAGLGPADASLIDFIETGWKQPDDGIWEVRGPRRHFTHSKVMAWVAVDRAVRDVEDFGLEGPIEEVAALRDEIHAEVCEKGFDPERNTFTQYYGSTSSTRAC